MTDQKTSEEFPLTLTKAAQDFLLDQLKKEGLDRKIVKFSMVFGKNAAGKGVYKYQVETIHAPDCVITLDNGFTIIVDGNSSLLMKGTTVDVKEGMGGDGQAVRGFIFSNPNTKNPIVERGCQGCPASTPAGCAENKECDGE